MHIKFVNPGFEYMLDSIMEFQKDDSASFWNDSLFYFFKELDKDHAYSLSAEKRKEYFAEKLSEIYKANETLLEEKVQAYSEYWNLHKTNITQAFSDAFGIDCSEMFNDLFKDSYEEYENPSLKWILSELVVEAVMSDERLSSINPYYPREQGGCIYPYFFTMEIEGVPITDTVHEMYRTMEISEFMEESYTFCQKHEAEIREHIWHSENGGVDK